MKKIITIFMICIMMLSTICFAEDKITEISTDKGEFTVVSGATTGPRTGLLYIKYENNTKETQEHWGGTIFINYPDEYLAPSALLERNDITMSDTRKEYEGHNYYTESFPAVEPGEVYYFYWPFYWDNPNYKEFDITIGKQLNLDKEPDKKITVFNNGDGTFYLYSFD